MNNFRNLVKIFKKEFSDYRFKIRRVSMNMYDAGDCICINELKNEYFIRINNKIKEEEQILWLLHEIAHAISWHYKSDDDHGVHWAKAYSKCYKIYLEKFLNG